MFSSNAKSGNLTVGIIGLGYVGLPIAIGFHDAGFEVWGVDISQRTVDMIKQGENPTGDPDVDDIIPAPVILLLAWFKVPALAHEPDVVIAGY